MVQPVAPQGVDEEVRGHGRDQAGDGAVPVGPAPHDAPQEADPHVGGHGLGEEERVEDPVDQEQGVEDPDHRDQEATEATHPEVVPVVAVRHELPVEALGEQRPAVHHERRARGHVRGQDAGHEESEGPREEQVPAGQAEGVLGVIEGAEASLRHRCHHHEADDAPPHGAEALDEVPPHEADPAGPLVLTGPHRGEHVGLGHDPDEAVEGQDRDHPGPDALGGGQRELVEVSVSRRPSIPPTRARPGGMSMKDSAMMRNPWKKSVQAEATRPPMKL